MPDEIFQRALMSMKIGAGAEVSNGELFIFGGISIGKGDLKGLLKEGEKIKNFSTFFRDFLNSPIFKTLIDYKPLGLLIKCTEIGNSSDDKINQFSLSLEYSNQSLLTRLDIIFPDEYSYNIFNPPKIIYTDLYQVKRFWYGNELNEDGKKYKVIVKDCLEKIRKFYDDEVKEIYKNHEMATKMMEENKAILRYVFDQILSGETNEKVNSLDPEKSDEQEKKRRKINGLLF